MYMYIYNENIYVCIIYIYICMYVYICIDRCMYVFPDAYSLYSSPFGSHLEP